MFHAESRLLGTGEPELVEEASHGPSSDRYRCVFSRVSGLRHASACPAIRQGQGLGPDGIASSLVDASSSTALPFVRDAWHGQHRLSDATALGTLRGAGVGFRSAQVFMYAWHRTMHANDLLWRWFHQMHHSAARVDVAGAFDVSPLDIVGRTFLGSLALDWAAGRHPASRPAVPLHTETSTKKGTVPFFKGLIPSTSHTTPLRTSTSTQENGIALCGTYRDPEAGEGETGFYDGKPPRGSRTRCCAATCRYRGPVSGRTVSCRVRPIALQAS